MQRGEEGATVREGGLGVAARGAEARRGGGGLVWRHRPNHEVLVPAADACILVDDLCSIEVAVQLMEMRLRLKRIGRAPHVDADLRARGEVLAVGGEELVHIGVIRDKPLEFEVLVNQRRAGDAESCQDQKQENRHDYSRSRCDHLGCPLEVAAQHVVPAQPGSATQAATSGLMDWSFLRRAAAKTIAAVCLRALRVQGQSGQEDNDLKQKAKDDGNARVGAKPAESWQDSAGSYEKGQRISR
mmetsp:Transcript_121320/g.343322  ORF Transcript_121320/g.343322 Transcript_121320/m.343322 type:complete len:243 (+) Transcript_121320:585-1313(+)